MMTKMTAVRVILFLLAWANSLLVSNGYEPLPVLSEDTVAYVVTFAVSIWALWKDNDITKKARERKAAIEAAGK